MHDAPPPSPDPVTDGPPADDSAEPIGTPDAVIAETPPPQPAAPEAEVDSEPATGPQAGLPVYGEPTAEPYPMGYAEAYPQAGASYPAVPAPGAAAYPGAPAQAAAWSHTGPAAAPEQPMPFPGSPEYRQRYGSSPGYAGALPPPVAYPSRRRRWRTAAGAVAVALLAAGVVFGVTALARGNRGSAPMAITDATAKDSIQRFLNALAEQDIETISRNQLCGLYDAVTNRQADTAVARLASAAYRKQYSKTEVTSIDALVPSSELSAQALFTIRATPAGGRGIAERQGIAQLQLVDNQVLTCSYIPRVAIGF